VRITYASVGIAITTFTEENYIVYILSHAGVTVDGGLDWRLDLLITLTHVHGSTDGWEGLTALLDLMKIINVPESYQPLAT
jgi:hypothetical protein